MSARQADADARLEDRVPLRDPPLAWIEHRPIQWVGHRADHLPCGIARQLGVRIQHDDVTHFQEGRGIADDVRKPVLVAAQQAVELRQGAALESLYQNPSAATVAALRTTWPAN